MPFSTPTVPVRHFVTSNSFDNITLSQPRQPLFLLLAVIPIWSFVTNFIVLYAFVLFKELRKTMPNVVIASLAFADLLLSALVMPLAVYFKVYAEWRLGIYVKLIWFCVDVFLTVAGIMNLCVMSVYRYVAIAYPRFYRLQTTMALSHVVIVLAISWGFALIISLSVLIESLVRKYHADAHNERLATLAHDEIVNSQDYMVDSRAFLIYGSVLTYYLPLAIMLAAFVRSVQLLQAKSRKKSKNKTSADVVLLPTRTTAGSLPNLQVLSAYRQTPRSSRRITYTTSKSDPTTITCLCECETETVERQRKLPIPLLSNHDYSRRSSLASVGSINGPSYHNFQASTKEMRAIRTLVMVFLCFVVFWTPFFVAQCLKAAEFPMPNAILFDLAWWGYASSGVNPVIYAIFNPEYKNCINALVHVRFNPYAVRTYVRKKSSNASVQSPFLV